MIAEISQQRTAARILVCSSLFPPDAKGGAEISAFELSEWLQRHGFEIGILTTAATEEQQTRGDRVCGFKTWRLFYPRPYSMHNFESASLKNKLIWHAMDHFDPRNVSFMESVLDEYKPDLVMIHLLTGLGFNSLKCINSRKLPVLYFLHDFSLACVRSSMFRNGKNCTGQCLDCRLSSIRKMSLISDTRRFAFVSPSENTLSTLSSVINMSRFRSDVIPNLDLEIPEPRGSTPDSERVQLLFVGRLDQTKGADFITKIADKLSKGKLAIDLTVIGGGPLEGELRREYESNRSIKIIGRVPATSVKGYMRNADVLCVPSRWRENHPGVIRHALRAGVPVLVSNIGGAPEMICDGVDGLTLPAGVETAWEIAITKLATQPAHLRKLQSGAAQSGAKYSADRIGDKLVRRIQELHGLTQISKKKDAP